MTFVNSRSNSPAVGLSVGSTTLAAITVDHAVTARPTVMRAGHPVDGIVDRVGDPVGIVAADGSRYPAATLLAETLRDLARTVTAGRPFPTSVGVAYPGRWQATEVEALRRALRRVLPWSDPAVELTLLPDYEAALIAMRGDLPDCGTVAVCDFGGSVTTITLLDLAGSRIIGKPLLCNDFSGDGVDRALLMHVLESAGSAPGGTATFAIAPLSRLRSECRAAKERLSARTVTTIPGHPAGLRGDVRLTRPELGELIRASLANVVSAVQELLRDNGIAPIELAAVLSVGGGAAIPAIATALSQGLRAPVVTAHRPVLAAATGAALAVSWDTQASETVVVPAVAHPVRPPLAWSQADPPVFVPHRVERVRESGPPAPAAMPWHRRPILVAAAALMVIAGAGGATAFALRHDPTGVPAADATPRTVVVVPDPAGSG